MLQEPTMKRRLISLNIYKTYPLDSGGRISIHNLLKKLALKFDVHYIVYSETDIGTEKQGNGYAISYHIPKGFGVRCARITDFFSGILGYENNPYVFSYIMAKFDKKFSKYIESFCSTDKLVLLFEHPPLVSLRLRNKNILKILHAHNVEVEYFELNSKKLRFDWIVKLFIKMIERNACRKCNLIFAATPQDKETLVKLYKVSPNKIYVLPTGVNTAKIKLINDENGKKKLKGLLALTNRFTALYMGAKVAVYNVKAAEFICNVLAPKLPEVEFLVLGTVAECITEINAKSMAGIRAERGAPRETFSDRNIPKNVRLVGFVDETQKYQYLGAADIALNPVEESAGISVKMLEYMAAGLPIVSTPAGVKGMEIQHGKHAMIVKLDEFENAIRTLMWNKKMRDEMSVNLRRLAEEKYDCGKIAEKATRIITSHL